MLTERYITDIGRVQVLQYLYPTLSIYRLVETTGIYTPIEDIPTPLPQYIKDYFIQNENVRGCDVQDNVAFRYVQITYNNIVYRVEIPVPFSDVPTLYTDLIASGGTDIKRVGEKLPPSVTSRA